jgi:hypothetical protein
MSKRISQEVVGSNPFGHLVGLTFAVIELVPTVDYSSGQLYMDTAIRLNLER